MNNSTSYKMLSLIALFFGLFSPLKVFAQQNKIDSLSHTKFWLDLLYMEEDLFGYSSQISNDDFFLSPNGRIDPRAELLATISQAYKPQENENINVQCRYPARVKWLLSTNLLDKTELPKTNCKSLNQWYTKGKYQSISLTFVTGYLANPASLFGHVFLKFNEHPINSESNLLNQSVNFGAINFQGDNPLVYAIKGLFGGYEAVYSQTDFFTQNSLYGNTQLRDLWEYELNLTSDDVEYISYRVWEMFFNKFQYLFLTKNCAYFIVDPLEKQLNLELLADYLPYSLPKHTIEDIEDIKIYNDEKLIKSVHYFPSKQGVFYNKYKTLNTSEQTVFISLIKKDTINFEEDSYSNLPLLSKKKLLDVLLDYNSYRYSNERHKDVYKKTHQQILIERFKIPPNLDDEYAFPKITNISPTIAPKSSTISLGNQNEQIQFRFRPASHDFLMSEIARAPNTQLQSFDMVFSYVNKEIQLHQFTLLDIQTLSTSSTGLPGDWGFAWSMNFAFEPLLRNNLGSRAFITEGQIGYSPSNSQDVLTPYLLVGGAAFSNPGSMGNFKWSGRFGLLFNHYEGYSNLFEAGLKHWVSAKIRSTPYYVFNNKFKLSRNVNLGINYTYELSHIASTQIFYFW